MREIYLKLLEIGANRGLYYLSMTALETKIENYSEFEPVERRWVLGAIERPVRYSVANRREKPVPGVFEPLTDEATGDVEAAFDHYPSAEEYGHLLMNFHWRQIRAARERNIAMGAAVLAEQHISVDTGDFETVDIYPAV